MFKKVFVVSLALSVITFFQMASTCFAETSGNIEQAKQQIFALIQSGDYVGADTATNKMIADFANSPGVDEAVHQIALKYQGVKNYQKTIELSRQVIANWPQSPHAGWSQMDIVMANLSISNETAVQAEVETLISRYKDDPNLPKMLSIIGQGYRKEDFGRILKQDFNDESSAKIRLAILNADIMAKIESGDYGASGRSVDKMIAEFSSDADLPEILLTIAQQFVWCHQYEQAGNIYQQVVQRYPTSPSAVKAQQCVSKTGQITNNISSLIESGNYSRVTNAIDELIVRFGDEADTPSTIYDIAGKLESAGQFALARQVYEQIVWRYPTSNGFADIARIAVQRTKVLAFDEMGDETSAKSTFDGILNDFNSHPYLPANVMWTAEGYYRKACKAQEQGDIANAKKYFDKTLQTLDIVQAQFPASAEIPNALCLVGDCCRKLSDYQKSAEFYQRVVDNYPAYNRADQALFMVGRNYENIQNVGPEKQLQIQDKIRTAYKQLLEKYPDCGEAKIAARWLAKH